MAETLPPGRHGLPRDFVLSNQRDRLLAAFAEAVAESGYCAVTIKDVCGGARVSRRTFYEHFLGIDRVALAIIEPLFEEPPTPGTGLYVFAVEAACDRSFDPDAVSLLLGLVRSNLDADWTEPTFEPMRAGVPKAPPGQRRPQLPREVWVESARYRLRKGTARVLAEKGYAPATVNDIVTTTGTARNTFYESFSNKEAAVKSMVEVAAPDLAPHINLPTGVGILLAELVAVRFLRGHEALEAALLEADSVLDRLGVKV